MSLFRYILLLVFPLLGVNLYATVMEIDWLMQATQLLSILSVLAIYLVQKKQPDLSALIFIAFFFFAQISEFFIYSGNFMFLSLFFYIGAYIVLSREAVRQTRRQKATKMMLLYCILLFILNSYLLFTHVIELKSYMSSNFQFAVYIIYYLNLLFLGILSLIYYLNSYSKKSIYCIVLVLSFIFAAVFRDTAHFYVKDSAILITGNLLWFTGLSFCLLFFLTPERKLRLLNLI